MFLKWLSGCNSVWICLVIVWVWCILMIRICCGLICSVFFEVGELRVCCFFLCVYFVSLSDCWIGGNFLLFLFFIVCFCCIFIVWCYINLVIWWCFVGCWKNFSINGLGWCCGWNMMCVCIIVFWLLLFGKICLVVWSWCNCLFMRVSNWWILMFGLSVSVLMLLFLLVLRMRVWLLSGLVCEFLGLLVLYWVLWVFF